jgi:hypothetical protein
MPSGPSARDTNAVAGAVNVGVSIDSLSLAQPTEEPRAFAIGSYVSLPVRAASSFASLITNCRKKHVETRTHDSGEQQHGLANCQIPRQKKSLISRST